MASYIIKATNLNGDDGTVVADVGFAYSDNLNDINEADIKISSTSTAKRSLLEIGSIIEISRETTLEFKGIIDDISYLTGGTVVFHVTGYEFWLVKENGDYANSPWQATASATIFSDIIGESNYLTAGTIEAGFSIDFRLIDTQSIFNGITNLAKKTTQDIQIDYTDLEVDILDHRGSTTSVGTFNDGKNIENVRVNFAYPLGNHILVKGKGDGDNQIKGSAQDATSISTYGRIKRTVIDRSCSSTAEANKLADAELPLTKDITKILDFDFINPNESVSTGDIITINADEVSDETFRIVGLQRGIRGTTEFLKAQVTNPAFKQLIRVRNKILARFEKNNIDANSYMQGSGNENTWGLGINAKTNNPLKIQFFLPTSYIQDEIGNTNVKNLTVSYDIDPYKSQYGTASYDGSDPQVQNSSANTEPDVENSSGLTAPDVANDSGLTAPSVSGTSGVKWSGSQIGSDTGTGVSCSNGVWTTVASVPTTNTDLFVYANFYVKGDSGGPEDILVKLENTGEITGTDSRFAVYQDGFRDDAFVRIDGTSAGQDDLNDAIRVRVWPFTGAITVDAFLNVYEASHSHSDGSYAAANHSHDDGTYSAANHSHDDGTYNAANHPHADGTYDINAADIDNISIGDDVSDAGSLNSASVNLYLDFWNGSNWINKHSILNTGVTIETDVDISNSGTYPDAAGYWRVRIEPITATPDFAQGIVRIKNAIDN